MTVLYYRKLDGVILGSCTGKQLDILKEKETWGNGVEALVLDSMPDLTDKIATVKNDQLVLKPDLDKIAKRNKFLKNKQDGLAELKKLGLTDDQLTALFGG